MLLTVTRCETGGTDSAEEQRAMTDSAKLQMAAVVMLVCGVLGLFFLMR